MQKPDKTSDKSISRGRKQQGLNAFYPTDYLDTNTDSN